MLKGTLDDFTLPDVFRLMSFAKKTGRVDIMRSAGQGKVFFRDGEVYYAESSLSKEPLGQKLVRARAITDGQLMKALDEQASSGERLGAVLVSSSLVTEDQLMAAVRQQIEDSVFDLLRWELGEFAWEPGAEFETEVHIAVSVENLIMEASRRLDEYEVIQRKIPSGAAILGMAAAPPEGAVEINITPDEWRILVLVDGNRTVNDIATMVGLDEFGAMRVLYGLVSAGLIELISEGETAEPAARVVVEETPMPEREMTAVPVVEEAVIQDLAAEPIAEETIAEPDAMEELEQLVAEVESEPETDDPETDEPAASGPLISDELAGDLVAVLASDQSPAESTDDMDSDALSSFGIGPLEPAEEPVAASTDSADWSESPIEEFDAPTADELVTSTPDADPFMNDLFGESSATTQAQEEPPAPPAPVEEEMPVSSAPSGDAPSVDRAAVVRELAGLFSDEERPRARPSAPRPAGSSDEEDDRKRVEDDDQVTKGIISRLIDGVKGL